MGNQIDRVDFAILKALQETDEPLWKKRIHEYIEEHEERLPIAEAVSVQTVGRRIDQLLDNGYVDNLITDPDELNRDLAIVFELTEQGQDEIETCQEQLLKNTIKDQLFPDETFDIGKEALVHVMRDYFAFDDEMEDALQEYSRDELAAFLTIRYAQKETVDILDEGHLDEYRDVLDNYPQIKQALDIH